MLACGLHRALERAGIPIVGVSIGRATDRATWRVWFTPSASGAQRAQAAAIVAAYELATDSALKDEDASRAVAMKVLTSLARVTWEHLPIGKPTWQEFLARWKAIYLA